LVALLGQLLRPGEARGPALELGERQEDADARGLVAARHRLPVDALERLASLVEPVAVEEAETEDRAGPVEERDAVGAGLERDGPLQHARRRLARVRLEQRHVAEGARQQRVAAAPLGEG